MGRTFYQDGPFIDGPIGSTGPFTNTAIEDLWTAATRTPIFANTAKAGKIFCVRAGGTVSLTGGTAIITPLWSPASTALGPSLTVGTVTAAIAAWYLSFDLLVYTVGAPGVSSTVVGTGFMAFNGGVLSGTANPNLIVFGGTIATVDLSIDGAIQIRKTFSATNSLIVQHCCLFSRN